MQTLFYLHFGHDHGSKGGFFVSLSAVSMLMRGTVRLFLDYMGAAVLQLFLMPFLGLEISSKSNVLV
jgi:hypothetical protein